MKIDTSAKPAIVSRLAEELVGPLYAEKCNSYLTPQLKARAPSCVEPERDALSASLSVATAEERGIAAALVAALELTSTEANVSLVAAAHPLGTLALLAG